MLKCIQSDPTVLQQFELGLRPSQLDSHRVLTELMHSQIGENYIGAEPSQPNSIGDLICLLLSRTPPESMTLNCRLESSLRCSAIFYYLF